MPRVSKFEVLRATIFELCSKGYSFEEIVRLVGCHRLTLWKWLSKNPKFHQECKKANEDYHKGLFLRGVRILASEEEEIIEKEEFIEIRVINGEPREVKKTITRKRGKPSEKALQMLANKYFKGEYSDNTEANVNIQITQNDRALSIEDRLKIIQKDSNDIEAVEYRNLNNDDI